MPADFWQRPQRLDHPRGDVPGMRARETDPFEAVDAIETLEESREIAVRIVRCLVVVDDLPEQLDLPGAGGDGLTGVRHDVGGGPHSFLAPRVRHHTEGTE